MTAAMGGHRFHPSVLREYDIRGVVGDTLSEADARALGAAFGTIVLRAHHAQSGAPRVCVGYDGRDSSPALEAALVQGLSSAGIAVSRVGRGPTPMLYFAVHHLGADGGVMVTGSHNPPEYNGFKMMLGTKAFYGDAIRRLGRISASGDTAQGSASVRDDAVFDAYVARLLEDYRGVRPLTVAWDAGNGAAGEAMSQLTAGLPGTHVLLNETIDGSFPNHHPDPTVPENLIQLRDAVRANDCDLGLAFDGDGDRVGAVDGEGEILWADQIMVALASEVLEERPGATIIADVKASQVLFDEIRRMGGDPLMYKTGHSLIKAKMAELEAPLAGEMSGHIFFADRFYGFDDGLYAGLRLVSYLSRSGKSLAEIRRDLPAVVNTPELRFPCAEDRKLPVVEEVKARLAAAGADVTDIDGVRVRTEDGWWLLRASNTQDVLVARCEAEDEPGLERLRDALRAQLSESGLDLPDM